MRDDLCYIFSFLCKIWNLPFDDKVVMKISASMRHRTFIRRKVESAAYQRKIKQWKGKLWINTQSKASTFSLLVFLFMKTTYLCFQSRKRLYIHKCLSVNHRNPSTAWNHHPSSFILQHSSFILQHSSFFISRLLSFSACL